MKRLTTIILAMLLSSAVLVGCTESTGDEPEKSNATDSTVSAASQGNTASVAEGDAQESEQEIELKRSKEIITHRNDKSAPITIFTPSTLSDKVVGFVAAPSDGTRIYVDKFNEHTYDDDSFDEKRFPTDFASMIDAVKYDSSGKNSITFVIENAEKKTINGYEMIRYSGTHSFTDYDYDELKEVNHEMKFFGYATRVKANGACVYWIVIDDVTSNSHTDDSLKLAEIYADKMAESLKE